MPLTDKFGRPITDLRISVTDRCNFRCVYCRSADPENHMAGHELLRWDELERLARILIAQGIRKVRVTGGEPLVREGVEDFIAALKKMGVADLSITTNGHLLADRLRKTPRRRPESHQHQPRFARSNQIRGNHAHQILQQSDGRHRRRPILAPQAQ